MVDLFSGFLPLLLVILAVHLLMCGWRFLKALLMDDFPPLHSTQRYELTKKQRHDVEHSTWNKDFEALQGQERPVSRRVPFM